MSQQQIEPKRAPLVWSTIQTEFSKINSNFTELYLSLNGDGVDLSNIGNSLIPDLNLRNLGSVSNKWNALYLGAESLWIENSRVSANNEGGIDLPLKSTINGVLIRDQSVGSFNELRVSGQPSIVASSAASPINLISSGISITTNNNNITFTNTGVTNIVAGSGISVSAGSGSVTITNALYNKEAYTKVAVSGQTTLTPSTSTSTLNVSAGAGITLTTNASTNTLTITGTATQNIYQRFAVSGQTTLTPSTSTSTLNITSGNGIEITTNAGNNTLSISTTTAELLGFNPFFLMGL